MQVMKGWCKMMANEVITNEQKCMELISKLNEKVLATVLMFLEGVADQERHLKTTPAERVQEIEEKIKRREEEERRAWEAERKAWETEQQKSQENFKAAQNELQQWIDEKLEAVEVPARYDITIEDMGIIFCGLNMRSHDLLWDTICGVYNYGFKKGCNYIKNKNKKKATAKPTK